MRQTACARRVATFISGQKRGVLGVIKRELRRRCAIEALIGHMKTDGHLGRCHLKGRQGDAASGSDFLKLTSVRSYSGALNTGIRHCRGL